MLTIKMKKALCLSLLASLSTLTLSASDHGRDNRSTYSTAQLIGAGAAGLAIGVIGAASLYHHFFKRPRTSNFPYFSQISEKSIVVWNGIRIAGTEISSGRIDIERVINNLTEKGYSIFIEKGIKITP